MDYQTLLYQNYHKRTSVLDPDDEHKLSWFRTYVKQMYDPFFRSFLPNAKILDLGCSRGFLLKVLFEKGHTNLTGVDLSPKDLDTARLLLPEAHFYAEDIFAFLQNNAESFDAIILKALIEHIKKDRVIELLELIAGALKPGGKILIDVQNSAWIFGLHDRYVDFTHEIGFTQESLAQLMQLHFNHVKVTPTQSPLFGLKPHAYIRHKIAKKIVSSLLRWAEPESPYFQERLLLGIGTR